MLDQLDDIKIVDEATTGSEAVQLAMIHKPQIVLMDVRMPDMDGLKATAKITSRLECTSVLMLTSHDSPEYLLEAIRSGAAGYLLKDASVSELHEKILAVVAGESPIDAELAKRTLRQVAHDLKDPTHPTRPKHRTPQKLTDPTCLAELTPREKDTLRLLALGKTNEEIANALYLAISTVKNYVLSILAKLKVPNRTQAAVAAIELGILEHSPA